MGFLRLVGLALFSFLFLVSVISFVLLESAQVFFDSSFYMAALDKMDAYSEIKAGLISSFVESSGIPIDSKKLRDSLERKIPDSFFREQINSVIENALAYLKGNKELNLKISFNPVKKEISEAVIEAAEVGQKEGQAIENELANKDLTIDLGQQNEIRSALDNAKAYVGYMNKAYLFTIVALLLFGVAVLLLSKGLKGKVRNISAIILVAGALLIALSFTLSKLSVGVENLLAQFFLGELCARINLLSYLLIFIGFVGLVISFFVK
jgi:hypothetical protein